VLPSPTTTLTFAVLAHSSSINCSNPPGRGAGFEVILEYRHLALGMSAYSEQSTDAPLGELPCATSRRNASAAVTGSVAEALVEEPHHRHYRGARR
jgi:hypothetical protein